MYPLHFYLCLLASCGLVVGLILLAVFPVKIPIVKTVTEPTRHPRTQRPRKRHVLTDWVDWDSDEEDL